MLDTIALLRNSDFPSLRRGPVETLQVNLGYRCNQQCLHCHVNAGPNRREMMSEETMTDVLAFLQQNKIKTLDLTGGAPEMHPQFRHLVTEARRLGLHVMDRCNLTILQEPGYESLVDFLAEHEVEIVSSLPCYLEENVDSQRGKGVFEKSIAALRALNQRGYGTSADGLQLNLVYNPVGAYLPPSQQQLRDDYVTHLKQRYDVEFNQLYTLANMPIKRFGSTLLSKGQFEDYMQLLRDAHQEANLDAVMCKSLISVDWQGYLYDCDFNQMLDLPLSLSSTSPKKRVHISSVTIEDLDGQRVSVMDHCYGCTAGQGSSCGGALS